MSNFGFDMTSWVVWANTNLSVWVFFFVFFATCRGRAGHPVWTYDGSKRVFSCAFGGLNDDPLNFVDQGLSWNLGVWIRLSRLNDKNSNAYIWRSSWSRRHFYRDIHHEWVFVGGRILTLPIYSKWRLVGVLNFVKMLKSPSWMKIFAPNLVGRCIMAMQRYGNKRLIPWRHVSQASHSSLNSLKNFDVLKST